MEEKGNFYHFIGNEDKPYIALCKDLFENTENADVTFVTKNKIELKAHKLVLSLSSTFFKNLFEDQRIEYKILLPNYSDNVLSTFLLFFYTGEILIEEACIEELASLCHELNCQEIPVLAELILKHKNDDLMECKSIEENPSNAMVEQKTEIEFDESEFFENDNVETIFFNENEGEFMDSSIQEQKSNETNQQNSPDSRIIKEEYEVVQYIDDDNPQFELVEENEKNKHELARKKLKVSQVKPTTASITFPAMAMNINQLREEQNRFKKRLQEAINSCRDSGNSTKKAAKMFGVPIDAIERNLRGFKKANP